MRQPTVLWSQIEGCWAPGLKSLSCLTLAQPALRGTMWSRLGSMANSGLILRFRDYGQQLSWPAPVTVT